VQRRDPVTGALIASSAPFEGVTQPALAGVIDGGIWFSEAGGMMGYVGRLSLRTLRASRTRVPQNTYHTIGASVIDGILWISNVVGGRQENYCGDPLTGRLRASFVNSTLNDQLPFLTADAHYVYLSESVAKNSRETIVIREPISPRCR
jgi:hypothetical protein